MTDKRFSKYCIWDALGEKQEVFSGPNETTSVNPYTTGWLDVAVLFDTEYLAIEYMAKHEMSGYVFNVREFVEEYTNTGYYL